MKDNVTIAAETGYNFTPNWAIGLTEGCPPTTEIEATGSLKSLGKLGSITDGPVALTAQYRFTDFGKFVPYLGAGWSYILVLDSKDKAVRNLNVDDTNDLGLQGGGFEYHTSDTMGLFFDAKHFYLDA